MLRRFRRRTSLVNTVYQVDGIQDVYFIVIGDITAFIRKAYQAFGDNIIYGRLD